MSNFLRTSRKIVAIGRNYVDHAKELGNAVPKGESRRVWSDGRQILWTQCVRHQHVAVMTVICPLCILRSHRVTATPAVERLTNA